MNRMSGIGLAILLACTCVAGQAAVFKCKQPNGTSVYQDMPCDPGMEKTSAEDAKKEAAKEAARVAAKEAEKEAEKVAAKEAQKETQKQMQKSIEKAWETPATETSASGGAVPPDSASPPKIDRSNDIFSIRPPVPASGSGPGAVPPVKLAPPANAVARAPTSYEGSGPQTDPKGEDKLFTWIVTVVVWGILAGLMGKWAQHRNRSFWKWFILAFVFNPFFIALLFLFRGQDPSSDDI